MRCLPSAVRGPFHLALTKLHPSACTFGVDCFTPSFPLILALSKSISTCNNGNENLFIQLRSRLMNNYGMTLGLKGTHEHFQWNLQDCPSDQMGRQGAWRAMVFCISVFNYHPPTVWGQNITAHFCVSFCGNYRGGCLDFGRVRQLIKIALNPCVSSNLFRDSRC